jgi:hypothetical protein
MPVASPFDRRVIWVGGIVFAVLMALSARHGFDRDEHPDTTHVPPGQLPRNRSQSRTFCAQRTAHQARSPLTPNRSERFGYSQANWVSHAP